MKKIIKYLTLSVLGFFTILISWNVIEISLKSFFASRTLNATSNTQLYVHLNSEISDFPETHSFLYGRSSAPSVWEVEQGLRTATDDSRITSVLLHIDSVQLTVAQAYAMGEAINYFKSKGKKVECYSGSFSAENGRLPAYLLASYCDKVALQRFGHVKIEPLKFHDIMQEDYADIPKEKNEDSPKLKKISQHVDTIIRKNRGVNLQLPIDSNPHIDKQAVSAGLVDIIAPRITRLEPALDIREYVRLIEKDHINRTNVVAVISTVGPDLKNMIETAYKRSDIKAIVISVRAEDTLDFESNKIDFIPNKIFQKSIIVYVAGVNVGEGQFITYPQGSLSSGTEKSKGTLNNAIEVAIKLASVDTSTVQIEIIQTGTLIKDLLKMWTSTKKMFSRSINHVTKMTCGSR